MNKIRKLLINPLFWIFFVALFLRIYKLNSLPFGFHVDEVKVAWNALSILKTGRDDHGGFLSLYYNSFGDYRPTGIFYFTIPSIEIFGRTDFATRFPVALFGALTIFPVYLLAEFLNKNRKLKLGRINTGHLAGFLLAISPWSVELSRATDEVVISAFFALFSLYFFIKLIKTREIKFAVFSVTTIIISYLLYSSIRFLGPLFFIATLLMYLKSIKRKKNKIWIWACIACTLLLTAFFGITQGGLARFDEVSIFKDVDTTYQIQRIRNEDLKRNLLTIAFDNKYVIYFKSFADQYGKYFAGDFLVGSAAQPYRFTTPGTGLITYIEALLLIIGLIEVVRGKKNALPILLLLMAPLPAAITIEDAPNLSRAFFMLPFLIIIEAYGLETVLLFSRKFKRQIIVVTFSLLLVNFSYFLYMYFFHSFNHGPYLQDFVVDSPTYRDIGAKELALQLDTLKLKYDKIIITNFPDNPYPWYAFFTNKDPSDFNKTYSTTTNERDYGNIDFSEEKCPSDKDLIKYRSQNILMVDSWECAYQSQIDDKSPLKIVGTITRPDGTVVYTLLERDWSKPL